MKGQKTGKVTGAMKTDNKRIQVKLPIVSFEDSGQTIVYCPSIDVYGYGATEAEAIKSFRICLYEILKFSADNNNPKQIS